MNTLSRRAFALLPTLLAGALSACACESDRSTVAEANADAEGSAALLVAGTADRAPLPARSEEAAGERAVTDSSATFARIGQVMAMNPEGDELVRLTQLVREDPNPAIREAAVVALANTEDGRAIDALIAAATDKEHRVALAAIELLSWSDDRQARATLEALASSEDEAIASAAARIVAQ